MKRIEENGNVYFEWEPHEEQVKQSFERVMFTPDLEDLIDAILLAQARRVQDKTRAWRQVYKLTGIDEETHDFQYFAMAERVRVIPKERVDDFLS